MVAPVIDSPQSPFVTALAWLFIALSGVSVLGTLLQIIVVALAIGPIALILPINVILLVIPAMILAVGVGLLKRRHWARIAMVVILVAAILITIAALLFLDPNSETEISLGSGETSRLVFAQPSTFLCVAGLFAWSLCIYVLCRADVKSEFGT